MSWRLEISHVSRYRYDVAVSASYNEARMTPVTDLHQTTVSAEVTVSPAPSGLLRYWDYWGAHVVAFDVHEPHRELVVTSRAVVETEPVQPASLAPGWDALRAEGTRDAFDEFLAPTAYAPADPALGRRAAELSAGRAPGEAALAICEWVHGAMTYRAGATAVHTSAVQALGSGEGVCQDYAHVALVLLRAAGLPARYVSGYLHPDADAVVGVTAVGQSHAWVEVYTGEWWGHDPTNALPIGPRHVGVARGRDYADVAPLRGLYSGDASSEVAVHVAVTRLR